MVFQGRRAVSAGLAVLVLLGPAGPAGAGPGAEWLKVAIDRVIQVLEDPALRGEGRAAERRQALRGVTDGIFDWTEMARRALARHWEARSEDERREFVGLFRDLLERAYVSKIERYSGERIVFAGESLDGEQATVRTRILGKPGQEVTMDYRLLGQGDRWAVYDVVIEGVSLVSNYRTQFEGIIRTSSYEELVRRIRNRTS